SVLHQLVDGLYVAPPLHLGLGASIELLGKRAATERQQVVVHIGPRLKQPARGDDSVAVYRIVQEALTNASRHSRAPQVDISVHQAPSGLRVIVRDNGRGFDTSTAKAG